MPNSYQQRNKTTKAVSWRFPIRLLGEIDRIAGEWGVSRSQVVQRAVGMLAKEHPCKYPELPKE